MLGQKSLSTCSATLETESAWPVGTATSKSCRSRLPQGGDGRFHGEARRQAVVHEKDFPLPEFREGTSYPGRDRPSFGPFLSVSSMPRRTAPSLSRREESSLSLRRTVPSKATAP